MNRILIAIGALWLAGCSPYLNWREVQLEEAGLEISLPCKPDNAQRQIELAGMRVLLSMAGCDADGATFAVSHALLPESALVGAALTHWRQAVLVGLDADKTATSRRYVPTGALELPQSMRSVVDGGRNVSAQGIWFARPQGSQIRIYHAVMFSHGSRNDVADTFFAGIKLQ